MSRKSNFLIAITEKDKKSDIREYPDLSNNYYLEIRNLIISFKYSSNTVFIKSKNENVIILFSGNIYQDDIHENASIGEYLLEKYLISKNDFVKNLNGSYCLFLANKETGEVYFTTDRLNTRKIFYYQKGKELLFTTDLNYLPLSKCNLSYAGISSYLINGAIYNNLTLFEEIIILERASRHSIVDFKVISDNYWDYYFTNEYENKSETELSYQLNNLYLKSLERRIKGKKNIFISLSGGYDSRGIAGMIKNISDINSKIICFSHNFDDNIKDTDSGIASQIADKLGFTFKLLKSYNGNPSHTIKYNAEFGQGIAYFCVESDAWEQINKEFDESENAILLVGDMNDGTFTEFHGNNKRALERTQIYESVFLKEFRNYFSSEIFRNLIDSWNLEYNKLLNKLSVQDNITNLLDYLYIDQRIPHVNSVARECFQMPFIETATPYYDNDVLDFMRKLPSGLRDNKKLHRMTLKNNYPDLFKIHFPTKGWGNESAWINEIKSFSDSFINEINNNISKLDNIILPDIIIDSILALSKTSNNKSNDKTVLKSLHNTLKKIYPSYYKVIENIPGGKELTRKSGKFVNQRISHILPKILILRYFLRHK